jgi:hypothetical protein
VTDPDGGAAGIMADSLHSGRVPWIPFAVACGDDAAPWLVTPKIGRDDLEQVDGNLRYLVE